jgi:hypothetical protein
MNECENVENGFSVCPLVTELQAELQLAQSFSHWESVTVDKLRGELDVALAVLQSAIDCGMVPTSSALEGGANRHSEQCRVADRIRAVLNPIEAIPEESEK